MWVRGLKQAEKSMKALLKHVAPRVGAWIETSLGWYPPGRAMSHPVWVRGLKPQISFNMGLFDIVAPRVGAWIETRIRMGMS